MTSQPQRSEDQKLERRMIAETDPAGRPGRVAASYARLPDVRSAPQPQPRPAHGPAARSPLMLVALAGFLLLGAYLGLMTT
jgi:hypothetical protein